MENPPIKFNSQNPKSRKDYVCCGCGGKIPRGTRYRRDSGLWREGGFGDYHIHEECWLVMNMLEEYNYGDSIFSEALEQDWIWNYSTSRYRFKKERKAVAKVLRMLRRTDPTAVKRYAERRSSALFNNRRWSNLPWLSLENYQQRKQSSTGASDHLE